MVRRRLVVRTKPVTAALKTTNPKAIPPELRVAAMSFPPNFLF